MIKKILTYIASNFLEASITFLLIPIFTSKLSQEDYGILVLYFIFSKFLFPIINLNLNSSASIEYFKREKNSFVKYLKVVTMIPFFNMIVFTLIFYLLIYLDIMPFFKGNFPLFIPLFVWSQYIPNLFTSICQAKNESFKFGLVKNLNTITNFVFTFLLIEYTDYKIESQIIGSFIGNLIISVILFLIIFKEGFLKVKVLKKDFLFSFSFGYGIVFHSIAGVIMSMADRFIIEDIKGLNEVGYYSVGYQITTVLTIVATGISRSLVPTVYENLKDGSSLAKLKIVKYIYIIMVALVCFSIILYFCTDLIFDVLVDEKFNLAKKLVFPLILGLMFQGFYMFISSIFFYMKKNGQLSILTISSAVINIVLNYIFIPKYGALGAAYATLITYGVFWLVSWYMSNRVVKLPWFYFLNQK